MVGEALLNRTKFANEYCLIVQKQLILQSSGQGDGSVTDSDEPEKWLVVSGASSHFSPFIHLFLNLIPYEPIRILTGNGYITSGFKGAIPLIIKVEMKCKRILLENVLFVPSLKSQVNLFSIVVLADHGIHSNFGPKDMLFQKEGKLLAFGTRLGNSW